MPYNLNCDWKAGFVMDPQKKQRCGYLLALEGLGLDAGSIKPDIQVFMPFNAKAADYTDPLLAIDSSVTPNKVTCVGVLESLSWAGGVGDPISISAMLSSENAQQIKQKLQTTLSSTKITKLAWWISNFDEVNKKWFEEAYPKAPTYVTGQLNAPGGKDVRLHVADEAIKVAANIDVNVYEVAFEIVPAANSTYTLGFALDAEKKYVNAWGLKVGTQPATAVPA
jgi:hypothetical protein